MKLRRLLLTVFIALGLAPGTWMRSAPQLSLEGRALEVTRLTISPGTPDALKGSLALTGAWQLQGDHHFFGGFSALVARGDGTFLAGSDRGWGLTMPMEKRAPLTAPLALEALGREKQDGFDLIDLEALSWDAQNRQLWAAYEHGNVIERIDDDGTRREIRPVAMKDWTNNRGAETLARLADGRVLVITEAPRRDGGSIRYHEALLFPPGMLDPSNEPVRFRFVSHDNYRPVDAVQLPNGKIAILLRQVEFTLPPTFKTAVMIADPALIAPLRAWTGTLAFRMTKGSLTDNYEGITWVSDNALGTQEAPPEDALKNGAIYLISDDNFASFQRTLMLRLEWE